MFAFSRNKYRVGSGQTYPQGRLIWWLFLSPWAKKNTLRGKGLALTSLMWLLKTSVSHHSLIDTLNQFCQHQVLLYPSRRHHLCCHEHLWGCTMHTHHPDNCMGRREGEDGTGPSASIAALKRLSNQQHWANPWESRERFPLKPAKSSATTQLLL